MQPKNQPVGFSGFWGGGGMRVAHLCLSTHNIASPPPISWGSKNSCAPGVRRPGPGNAVAWRKGTWRAGPKDKSSYWLHAGRETNQSGKCCSLAQWGMAGRAGRQSVMWLKIQKRGANQLYIFLTGWYARLDLLSELFAAVWTNLRLIKAVCGLISRPMHNFLLFFLISLSP